MLRDSAFKIGGLGDNSGYQRLKCRRNLRLFVRFWFSHGKVALDPLVKELITKAMDCGAGQGFLGTGSM